MEKASGLTLNKPGDPSGALWPQGHPLIWDKHQVRVYLVFYVSVFGGKAFYSQCDISSQRRKDYKKYF